MAWLAARRDRRRRRCRVSEEWCGIFIGRRWCGTHEQRWDGGGSCPDLGARPAFRVTL